MKSFYNEEEGNESRVMRMTLNESSPVAKHFGASLNHSLLSTKTGFNRKLKMRDTFTKIFPGYEHGSPTCYKPGVTHSTFVYPKQIDGKLPHDIDRTYTKKNDFIKIYTEEILKIANMRRITK